MKKIISILTVIGAINTVNAAAVGWTSGSMLLPDGESYATGVKAYLFDASVVSASVLEASILDGTFLTGGNAVKALKEVTTTGTATVGSAVSSFEKVPPYGEVAVTLYMVVFDTNSFDTADWYKISSPITQTLVDGFTTTFPFGATIPSPGTPINNIAWQQIPEPATMALLGIGVVAFGLRRRK